MKKLFYIVVLVLVFVSKKSYSQKNESNDKQALIEKTIELLAEQTEEEEVDYTTLFDELNYFYDHPINLNNTNKDELQQLLLISDYQISNLMNHIEKNGKLISIYEIQAIEGFDLGFIQTILPFVKVTNDFYSPHISLKEMFKNGNNEFFFRYTRQIEEMDGFAPIDDSTLAANPNSRYLGSPERLYARYRFKYNNNVSWGITGEKDPGEQFFKGTQKNGFDFYSAHFYLKNVGKFKQLALGDFQLQFGQGLTLWSGRAFGKSADVMNIKKNALGVRPYTSVDENLFQRGAAATFGVGKIDVTGFASYKKMDANITSSIDTIGESDEVTVSSFTSSGLHRTESEMTDKDAIDETMLGGNATYKNSKGSLGLTAVYSSWGATLSKNVQMYNQFDFMGNNNVNAGLDYNYLFRNIHFFGEGSISKNGGLAFLSGALINLDNNLAFSVAYRNYQKDFQNMNSRGFAESSRTINEQGLYLGLQAKINKQFTFNGYFDKYRFPWLKFGVDGLSDGVDYLAQLAYKPSKKIELYFRVKQESKGVNTPDDEETIDYLVKSNKTIYRINATYKLTEALSLRSRVEFVDYTEGSSTPEKGFLAYQDVMYNPLSSPWSASFRVGLFDIDSYNSRIYAYENEVLYAFAVPSYYNRGMRLYLTTKYAVNRNIDVWFRYGQWYYDNLEEIGSGLSRTDGKVKSDVKLQVRLKF